MTAALARAIMAVGVRALRAVRAEWAEALKAEFEVAVADGKALPFALGCIATAWRELPRADSGRLLLANHLLALGVLVPTAAMQLACAMRFVLVPAQSVELFALPAPVGEGHRYLADAYGSAVTVLLALWLSLAAAHFGLALALLAEDRARLVRLGALTAALSVTIAVFTTVLFIGDARAGLQGLFVAVELSAVWISARWRDHLFDAPALTS